MDVGMTESATAEVVPYEKRRLSRSQRQQRKVAALTREVTNLEILVGTLLDHLEAAIQPSITDRDRIRYRCMIHDIRAEMNATPQTGESGNAKN